MDINITGNPGQGNTFQEIHIGTVQNYNPNATTVINNNYVEKPKPAPATERYCKMQSASSARQKSWIMWLTSRTSYLRIGRIAMSPCGRIYSIF